MVMSYTKKVIIGAASGFLFFTAFSHPKSWVHKRLPHKKVKNIHVLPHVKLHKKDKTYHLHHWLLASALYLPFLALKKSIRKSSLFHGFIAGSILQGLIYKDRFRFTYENVCCLESESAIIEKGSIKSNSDMPS